MSDSSFGVIGFIVVIILWKILKHVIKKDNEERKRFNPVIYNCFSNFKVEKNSYKTLTDYVVLDLETTGLDYKNDKIVELSMLKVSCGTVVNTYSQLFNPGIIITDDVTRINGISNEMIEDCPIVEEKKDEILGFIGTSFLVGHNLDGFDFKFLKQELGTEIKNQVVCVDTLKMARMFESNLDSYRLERLCKRYGLLKGKQEHRALSDCELTNKLLKYILQNAPSFKLLINE